MKILTEELSLSTRGQDDLHDLTGEIGTRLGRHGFKEGQVTVFAAGSTCAVVVMENEKGLRKDMAEAYERIAPAKAHYAHHDSAGDDNGSSHVRASIQGPSLTIPFTRGKLVLGQWQQVVLAEFDTRPRDRRVILQFLAAP